MRLRANARRPAAGGRRRGISLFEAIAAMTIVGMVATSALMAVGAGLATAARARRALEAEALVTQRVDALDLLTDLELQSIPDSVAQGQFPAPLDEYSWTTTSETYADIAGIYTIDIGIVWPQGRYDVRTHVYRRPVVTTRR
jgi:type II secretory pathway pseudopilin PulG